MDDTRLNEMKLNAMAKQAAALHSWLCLEGEGSPKRHEMQKNHIAGELRDVYLAGWRACQKAVEADCLRVMAIYPECSERWMGAQMVLGGLRAMQPPPEQQP